MEDKKHKKIGHGTYSNVYEDPNGIDVKKVHQISMLDPIPSHVLIENDILLNGIIHHPNLITAKSAFVGHRKRKHDADEPFKREIRRHVLVLEKCQFDLGDWSKEYLYSSKNIENNQRNVSKILYDIFSCLATLNQNQIIHGDIKPENIMINLLDGSPTAKLIDFGLAQYNIINQQKFTTVQTLWYRSPEVILSYPYYDERIDIWSMGVIIMGVLFNDFFISIVNDEDHDLRLLLDFIRILGCPSSKSWSTILDHVKKNFSDDDVDHINFLYPGDEAKINLAHIMKTKHQLRYQQGIKLFGEEFLIKMINLAQDCLTIDFHCRPKAQDILHNDVFKRFETKINIDINNLMIEPKETKALKLETKEDILLKKFREIYNKCEYNWKNYTRVIAEDLFLRVKSYYDNNEVKHELFSNSFFKQNPEYFMVAIILLAYTFNNEFSYGTYEVFLSVKNDKLIDKGIDTLSKFCRAANDERFVEGDYGEFFNPTRGILQRFQIKNAIEFCNLQHFIYESILKFVIITKDLKTKLDLLPAFE